MDDPITSGKGISVSPESPHKDSIFTKDRILSIGRALNTVYDSLGTGVRSYEKIPAYSRNAYDLLKSAAYAYHTSETENPKSMMHCAHSLRELFGCWHRSSDFQNDFNNKIYKNNSLNDDEKSIVTDMYRLLEYLHAVAHSNIAVVYSSYRRCFDDLSVSDEAILSRTIFKKVIEEFIAYLELLRDIILEREEKKHHDPT